MISGAERNRCVFRKKTQRFLFFYFQREQQRKDEPNEKKEKPMVRRFDTDCRSAGHHSLYPWKCAGVASCRSLCHLAVWATYYFLVPYIKEELHKREAKRIRKKCEKQDAAFDRFIIPEVSDPVEQVLLRHANYRISAYLQSVYPNATWEWREEFPERIIAKGGTGRVKLFGVDGYNFADVTFDQNGGINCALVNIVPLKQPNAPHPSVSDTEDTAEAPAAMPKQPDPVDPQVWYEVQGRKVLEALITDLHSRGYNSLTIRENGDIAIQQADSEKVRTAFESVPEKPYWARLCKVFEREGMAANITDGGILLSW